MFQESTVLIDAQNHPTDHASSDVWVRSMGEGIAMLAECANYEGVFGYWNTLHKPKALFDT